MLARLRGKKQTPVKQPSSEEKNENEDDEDKDKQGFICPMCMTSLPGPAELQVHFEKVHSEGGLEDNLIDVDNDETDALPESSSDDLLSASATSDFTKSRLDFSLNSNAPDVEKEVVLLQQELTDLASALKEEKWYSKQLQVELDKVSKEREKVEEEKVIVEEEFKSQLRSAEDGYLQVVQENNSLKDELKFADYNTTKERHEKLKQQMLSYQNEAEEERQRRQAAEDNFKLLKNELKEGQAATSKIEEQLQARPSSDDVSTLQNEIASLYKHITQLEESNKNELDRLKKESKSQANAWNDKVSSLNMAVKELTLTKEAKDEQINSLQLAVSSASDVSSLSKQQSNEKQQQVIELQRQVNELTAQVNQKDNTISDRDKQINESKLALANESNAKERVENDLHTTKTSLEEQNYQSSLLLSSIKELENNITKEKDEVNRLEKEKVELIARIEAGEGTQTVIQQLTQEKDKLLEATTSIEKTMAEQVKQHTHEVEIIRQEKVNIADELQKSQQEYSKTEKLLHDSDLQLQAAEGNVATLKDDIKAKDEQFFTLELESATTKAALTNEVKEKKKIISANEAEMKMIKEELQKLRHELKNSDSQQAQQASWIDTKNKSISEMTLKISSLQEQVNTKNMEMVALKKDLESAVTALNESKLSHEKLVAQRKDEMETMKLKFNAVQEKLMNVEAEQDEYKKNGEQLTVEKQQLEKVETELLQKKVELSGEIETLSAKLVSKEEELKNVNTEKEKNMKQLQLQINELEEKHSNHIAKKDEEIENINKQLTDAKINLDAEISKRNEADSEILSYQTKYNKLEAILEQKDEVLNDLQKKLEIAEQDLKKPCNSCKNYEIQLCRLQEATKDQSGQIAKLNEEISTLKNALEESRGETATITSQKEDLSKEFKSKEIQLSTTISDITEETNSLKKMVDDISNELDEVKTKSSNLESEKSALETSLSFIEDEKKRLLTQSEDFGKEILELKVDVATKTEEIEKLNVDFTEKTNVLLQEKAELQDELAKKQTQLTRETESHEKSKQTAQSIQQVLREESIKLKNKLDQSKVETVETLKSKDELEIRLNKDIETIKLRLVKIEQEVSNRDRRIAEYEMKLSTAANETTELKGDLTVLEAQIQNLSEEKRALLQRVLSTEEQHKKTKQKLSETNKKLDNSLAALQELGQENQNMQVQQAIKSNRQWEDDSEALTCKKCDKAFSLTVRKHHCRSCGVIFCSECSSFSAIMSSSKKPVRCCERCATELNSLRGTSLRRLSTSSTQSSQSTR